MISSIVCFSSIDFYRSQYWYFHKCPRLRDTRLKSFLFFFFIETAYKYEFFGGGLPLRYARLCKYWNPFTCKYAWLYWYLKNRNLQMLNHKFIIHVTLTIIGRDIKHSWTWYEELPRVWTVNIDETQLECLDFLDLRFEVAKMNYKKITITN